MTQQEIKNLIHYFEQRSQSGNVEHYANIILTLSSLL